MENPEKIHKGSVLITGGSGMIGRYLTSALLSAGYKVSHLSRESNQFGIVRVYRWDPGKKILDPEYLRGVDYIVHLAGANLGEKRWTKKRKEEIYNSRIGTAKLLYETAREHCIILKGFITASGTGYYGNRTSGRIYTEEDPPAQDSIASLCRQWEEAADLFAASGVRTVKIRTAVVLERKESLLHRLITPAKYGLVLRLGSGKQYMPWIHIADLCEIYIKAIEDNNMSGAYNSVAPHIVTHNEFMKTLAGVMKRPVILPNVPGFLVRAAVGDMAEVVLEGNRISSEKITMAGYSFCYSNLPDALKDIVKG